MSPSTQGQDRRDDEYADVIPMLAEMRAESDADHRSVLRDRVIERCLPLAEHVARRFADRGEAFDDLVQVARIGLVNAVDRFDVERGANFLSFAVPTVMGEVRRHFRDGTWSMRVPRRSKEISLRIGRAADELVQRLGRSPRPSELAEFLDLSVDEVIDGLMARSAYNSISIDAEADEQRQSIGDTLGGDDEHLAAVEDYVTLAPAMARLPERERNILSLRFFRGMSQSEIAAEVGISQMHVSRLLSRTLRALREELTDPEDAPSAG
ncbi:SigB/SigF/SigG family RNA polymerase sigma factor [Gordonia sp. N1V]|nr:SigB/SigF/SigG family RNA polymerase sigma factor [Gordonia sp. N1V]MDF3280990.1 SigB/SigF/SigG family RNA polymerase sigma factor [Gordonia sp. N1V]